MAKLRYSETTLIFRSLKIIDLLFKTSVPSYEETHYISITKTSRLMLFREIIRAYFNNHTNPRNTLCW
jgi:hypothetical protein